MKLKINNNIRNLPDFLIVGAARSGTTSLYEYLGSNPDIFLSEPKEPWFFSFMDKPQDYSSPDFLKYHIISNIEQYLKLFDNADERALIGEASPSYLLLHQETIGNIQKIYGERFREIKIIIVLRNPVDRTYSMYNHFKKDLFETKDFSTAIEERTIAERMHQNWNPFYDYISGSLYHKPVKDYMDMFPQTKIVFFDELKNDPEKLIREVSNFLEVEPFYHFDKKRHNESGNFKENLKYIRNIYKWYINEHNFPRKLLRKTISKKRTAKIESRIKPIFLETPEKLSQEKRDYLMKTYFREDLKNLLKILPENKKEFVRYWLRENE